MSESFIEALGDITDKLQYKKYFDQLLIMSKLLIRQTCLYQKSDFSYCRLAKSDFMLYYAQGKMYERFYELISTSSRLSQIDKEKMFETMRGGIIEIMVEFPFPDVNDFKEKRRYHKDTAEYTIDIKGEPLALLFVKFLENCDYKRLVEYGSIWSPVDKNDCSATVALF